MIINPLSAAADQSTEDARLVALAKAGTRDALEQLVTRHQRWIYNIALRMVYLPQDAEDVTQEILIKLITKLSTFEERSAFRTWLYRIVVNHVLNMKRTRLEEFNWTFDTYAHGLNNAPDEELADPQSMPADVQLLVEEAKIGCTSGMLLCLSREQRLVYTLGEVFGATDAVGAELLEISRDNFRQKLSRARRDLHRFMDGQCGLINEANPCRCANKTKAFIRAGYIDPNNLIFAKAHLDKVRDLAPKALENLEALDHAYAELHRGHPFHAGPDFVSAVRRLIGGALVVVAVLAASACARPAPPDTSGDDIIALEKGALARWSKGDPGGYTELMAADETYFDPTTEARVDGVESLKSRLAPLAGKFSIDRMEMINPRVTRDGGSAVLTFNLTDHGGMIGGPQDTARWNVTEVYRFVNGQWRIAHSHFSNVKPETVASTEARAAEARAIRALQLEWAKAWAAKDLDRIVNHYADDADVELADAPIVSGKPAIRRGVQQALADPNFALAFSPNQIEVAKGADLAYARGAYTTRLTEPTTRRAVMSKGKYIVVYRKGVDGQWKAVHDINNRD